MPMLAFYLSDDEDMDDSHLDALAALIEGPAPDNDDDDDFDYEYMSETDQ